MNILVTGQRIHRKHLRRSTARARHARHRHGQPRRRPSPRGSTGRSFCPGDLANRPQLDNILSQHKTDAVMHFAAEALVAKSVSEPSIFYATNVAAA